MLCYEQIEQAFDVLKSHPTAGEISGAVCVGVDVGTANIVSLAVDETGRVLDGEITPAKVVKEGLIVDYLNAVRIVSGQIASIAERLGFKPVFGASAYPPMTEAGNQKITQNILEAVGLNPLQLIDEPTAAALALNIEDGIIVDIGGGSTGISVLKNGEVIYVADEPTGGFQMDLVIAGRYGITLEAAEIRKLDPASQKELYHVIKPVFEKVAAIVRKHTGSLPVEEIYMVGGSSSFPGFEALMGKETGKPVITPNHALLVTPYGIACSCIKKNLRC